MADVVDPGFDTTASPNLTADDPLRSAGVDQWMEVVKRDHPDLAGMLITDPDRAMKGLADRGIPPPPTNPGGAMSFADPSGNNIDPMSGMPTTPLGTPILPKPITAPAGAPDPTASQGPYVMNKPRTPTPADSTPPPSASPALDPIPTPPVATPPQVASTETPTDISAKKKAKPEGVGDDISKMLGGLKALQPPPNPAVGTPHVNPAHQIKTPDITQLLAAIGAQTRPSPLETLGKLLVAGKA